VGVSTVYRLTSIPPRGYTRKMKNNKLKLVRRLKILEGQVRGLQNMVMKDVYCIDIITQTSAIKQGLSNIEDMLMEGHLGHCVVNQIKKGETIKATNEILKVYKLKRK
jgi:CsoR family transcriptional regulator, copper-sensing transcriptional repressor